MAEVRRGVGPNALPQGAATALNRAIPAESAYQDNEVPVQFVPDSVEDDVAPDGELGENMEVLLSDPDEGYRPPLFARDPPGRVPARIVRHLPQLMAAARDPDAPIALKAMYKMIVRRLEQEMQSRG